MSYCTLIFTILSLLKNSLFGTLVHMTKPMGGLISKVPVQMCMEIFVKQNASVSGQRIDTIDRRQMVILTGPWIWMKPKAILL